MKKMKSVFGLLTIFIVSAMFLSCSLIFDKIMNKKNEKNKSSEVYLDFLNWNKESIDLKIGGMAHVLLEAKPESKRHDAIIVYEYNSDIIKLIIDSRGAIIEGLKNGRTTLTARNGKLTSSAIVTVSGYDENYQKDPYIYSTSNIIQLKPGSNERVAVSLYQGSAEDAQNFKWISEKPDVAEIAPNGQFCLITAKGEGNSKITITHPKAAYPYSMLVYSLPDTQNAVFITTKENVVTVHKDKGEKQISVSLQNGSKNYNASLFNWKLENKNGNNVCSMDANADKAVITPLNSGVDRILVSHPEASYPLEILIRVVEIVKNVYIEPSDTFIELKGNEIKNISVELKGLTDIYDVNAFQWNVPDNEVINHTSFADEISVSGKKNGIVKISVSHPKAAYPRDIIISSKEQISDSIDSSMYITTSQNYIRTKVGAEQIPLNVLLAGGSAGDKKSFIWTVKHEPKEAGKKVIKLETTDGNVFSRAVSSYEDGLSFITPLNEGSAIIEISHPKILYPTEVLVKVLPEYAVLEEPLYFSGKALVKILNGKEETVTMKLNGKTKKENDGEAVKWNTESSAIKIIGQGENCLIKASGTGSNISIINVSHPKVENPKRITVLTADTQEALDAMKVLYAYKDSYKINAGKSENIYAEYQGFSEEEVKRFTFTSSNPQVLKVEPYIDEKTSQTFFNMCKITGLKTGESKVVLKANTQGVADLIFSVTVFPKDADISVAQDEVYLTTFQNVIHLEKPQESKEVKVEAVGLASYKQSGIVWKAEDTSIVEVAANGTSASFTAKKEGETKVIVSHEESQNALKIYVRVGKANIFKPDKSVYISTNKDALHMVKGEKAEKLTAYLSNSSYTASEFKFEIDKSDVAQINFSDSGTCFVKPLKAGQAMITVSHPSSALTKNVIVIVANSKEELEGFLYLTTANNVVTVAKGQSRNVAVAVMNAKEAIVDGYTWESYNPEIATANSSGASALIQGNEVGTTKIKVSNTVCSYPLEIIIVCVDASFAAENPYISVPASVLTLKAEKSSTWTTVAAALEGGSELDQQNFNWQIEDSATVQMFGQGNSCKLRAVKPGVTRLVITHPKASQPCYILLICDEVTKSKCHISVVENIINLKPQEGEKAITASLINGDVEDKYAFNWYLDTYDVVELNYSANVASIKPINQGQTTLHITHPKAAYEQQIIIKVSEYTQFEFGMEYYKITAGNTAFISMRVPVTSVPCHIEYSSLKPEICMIEGSNKIAQITGIKEGNTKVIAKLVATKTNTVQAQSEMLINVEKADEEPVYITASKTIFSIEKGTRQSIFANITGKDIGTIDQQNLKWKSSDTTVIKLLGASSTGIAVGPQCMLQALKAGECTVTVSHEKANSDLILKIIVPGTDSVDISLSKSYIRLETGGRTEIKAKLINAKPEDYKTIEWSIEKQNGEVIAEVLGKNETVAVFARQVGKTLLHARLPNGKEAKCDIAVEASRDLKFASQSVNVEPGEVKVVKYSVSPDECSIFWTCDNEDAFNYSIDEQAKTVTITGIKAGNGKLTGVTQYGNKAALLIKCTWGYSFSIDKSVINGEPDLPNGNGGMLNPIGPGILPDGRLPVEYKISYKVHPKDADINVNVVNSKDSSFINYNVDKTKNEIIIMPQKEGSGTLEITATNPRDNNHVIGKQKCLLQLYYKEVTLVPNIIRREGRFSKYKNGNSGNKLIIGDGESVTLEFKPDKIKAFAEITRVDFTPKNKSEEDKNNEAKYGKVEEHKTGNTKNCTILHTKDYKEGVYKIGQNAKVFENSDNKEIKEIKWTFIRTVFENDSSSLVDEEEYNSIIKNNSSQYNAASIKGYLRGIGKDGIECVKNFISAPTSGTEESSGIELFNGWFYIRNADKSPFNYIVKSEAEKEDSLFFHTEKHYERRKKDDKRWKNPGKKKINAGPNFAEIVFLEEAPDNVIARNEYAGWIRVEYKIASGAAKSIQIPVYTEIRPCGKNN